jgi:hypothetical protein
MYTTQEFIKLDTIASFLSSDTTIFNQKVKYHSDYLVSVKEFSGNESHDLDNKLENLRIKLKLVLSQH